MSRTKELTEEEELAILDKLADDLEGINEGWDELVLVHSPLREDLVPLSDEWQVSRAFPKPMITKSDRVLAMCFPECMTMH